MQGYGPTRSEDGHGDEEDGHGSSGACEERGPGHGEEGLVEEGARGEGDHREEVHGRERERQHDVEGRHEEGDHEEDERPEEDERHEGRREEDSREEGGRHEQGRAEEGVHLEEHDEEGCGAEDRSEKAPAKKTAAQLVVREDESPWTAKELKEVRAELDTEIQRLTAEISSAETDLNEFLKEPIDGAGDDQADAGAKSFEREHELSLVAGARTGLEQNLHALARLEDGTYGICENCGNPIGKLRLQAYPRATLCMTCKSRQERR